MNERFFSLPAEKQQTIINAGYRVFSQNSYKNSPMSEIAAAAGISKALLFHLCFGTSAFLRKGSTGVGLGIAVMMYFLNLIANIADVAGFLKYITPFGYCEGADIVSSGSLDVGGLTVGIILCIVGITAAYLKYTGKDIR